MSYTTKGVLIPNGKPIYLDKSSGKVIPMRIIPNYMPLEDLEALTGFRISDAFQGRTLSEKNENPWLDYNVE